ncbi:MAG: V-type ATPase subunit [Nanoarchaeota archaeon]
MDVTIPFVIGATLIGSVIVLAPVTKYALDMYPFLYANTRCSSRSGLLLSKKVYEELLAATSKEESFALLEDSAYNAIVEHSKEFFLFSKAIQDDLYKTYLWLSSIMPQQLTPIINSLKLKFEINEIKKVLADLKENNPINEIKYVHNHEFKLRLEGVKDEQSFYSAIEGTPYASLLQGKSLDNLRTINTLLDRYYLLNFSSTLNAIKDTEATEPFAEYLSALIDLSNLRLIIRSIESKTVPELIDGGTIKKDEIEGINDKAQLETALSNTLYAEEITNVNNLEKGFYRYLLKLANNLSAKYTIKSGAIIRFLILKEIEIINLNTIIKLKSENFEQEKIREHLII